MKASSAVNRQAVIDSHPYTKTVYKGRLYRKWNDDVTKALGRGYSGELTARAAVEDAVLQGNNVLNEAKSMK